MKSNTRMKLLLLAGAGFLVGTRMMLSESNRYELGGRVAIITGGSRGLGLVLARQLASRGVRLVICSRSEDQLAAAQRELAALGAEVLAVPCDVTDRSQIDKLIRATIDRYGKIDILVNNAGSIQVGPMDSMTIHDYEEIMKIHFWAPLYATLACLPHFRARKEGRIVNVASIGGKLAVPHLLPYSASKFALVGLSEGLNAELKKENILVSTMIPGLMRTGSARNVTVKGNHEKEYAWFKTAASMSLISEEPVRIATRIINALEYNKTHPTLSGTARLAGLTKEIAPEFLDGLMSHINALLPKNTEDGLTPKKGYESESKRSSGRVTRSSDVAARLNNEM